MKTQNYLFKYISHGIYLQIFIGFGLFGFALFDVALPDVMTSPTTLASILIMLGLNSLIYINKYRATIERESYHPIGPYPKKKF